MSDWDFAADDISLVLHLRAGNPRSLELLIERYSDTLIRYAQRIVHSSDMADDVVQDVFLSLWNGRATLEIHGSVKGYLFTAVRNRSLNLLRGEESRAQREARMAQEMPRSEEIRYSDSETYRLAIQDAIEMLPPRCREIFILVRQHNLSYPEVASTLGIALSTVKTQMTRAMVFLVERLAPYLEDGLGKR